MLQHTDPHPTMITGSVLSILYNFWMFANIQTPFITDLFRTVVLSIVGVVVSGLFSYLLRKLWPKIFKK